MSITIIIFLAKVIIDNPSYSSYHVYPLSAVSHIGFSDYDNQYHVRMNNVDDLYSYCTSLLPDIPYATVTIANDTDINLEDENNVFYHCRVETERAVFISSSTRFDGKYLASIIMIYLLCHFQFSPPKMACKCITKHFHLLGLENMKVY